MITNLEYDEVFCVNSLSFKYNECDSFVLQDINLNIERGDFVIICGSSGCGKTTLLRHLKPEIMPQGKRQGDIKYCGKDIITYDPRCLASDIGFVSQEADSQLVTDMVWHELAFGLENLGYDNQIIRKRVAECASYFGIQDIFNKKVQTLSGGQKQLVNLASVMVMRPEVIILDEPASQLDPISAREFIDILGRINRESGTTIIISEHRLDEVLELSNRVIVMNKGVIVSDEGVNEAAKLAVLNNNTAYFAIKNAMPASVRVTAVLGERERFPLSVAKGRKWLKSYKSDYICNSDGGYEYKKGTVCINKCINKSINENTDDKIQDVVIDLNDVWYRYKNSREDILKSLSLKIRKGNIYAVVGGNATGKSTLLSIIAGIERPYRGKVWIDKKQSIAYIPQNPELLFSTDSVEKELISVFSSNDINMDMLQNVIHKCKLSDLLRTNPFDLSGGEKQRLALAKILLYDNEIILLDEPSKGMDALFKYEFGKQLIELASNEKTIILVSHDIEFCAEYADYCGLLFDGIITSSGKAKEFFLDNSFFTTQVVMLTRGILDGCVTVEDVVSKYNVSSSLKDNDKNDNQNKSKEECIDKQSFEAKCNYTKINETKHGNLAVNLAVLIMYLAIMPLTVWAGMTLLNDQKYFFISLLLIIESIIPFFISFEKSRPSVKSVVIIAVMCVICVAGRQAFSMLPGCKPVVALVMISGIALGSRSGFIVGSMSMLVSNISFGQGPWTPWQMFAMGLVGLLSGMLFFNNRLITMNNKGDYSFRFKLIISAIGFIFSLIVYSGIVNMCMPLTTQANINIDMIIMAYLYGLPFDLLQAGTTSVVLFLIAVPMIKRIKRVNGL